MRSPCTRYFLARPIGVWHLILHRSTSPLAVEKPLDGRDRSSDGGPMKITPWYLAALAPFAAIGCSGAYLGHAAVVVLTIGIFLGTLSLGRSSSSSSSAQPPTIS